MDRSIVVESVKPTADVIDDKHKRNKSHTTKRHHGTRATVFEKGIVHDKARRLTNSYVSIHPNDRNGEHSRERC